MRQLSGGCLCGAIRFEAHGLALKVASCHCSMCRRASGSAFVPYAAYRVSDVRFIGEHPARYRSSQEAYRGSCARCGSTLSFSYDAEPEKIWLTLGCFDDPSAHEPTEDWYVQGKMPWVQLDDKRTHWPEAPDWVGHVTGRAGGS